MALKLGPDGLLHTGGTTAIFDDGRPNIASVFCPSGFGYGTHTRSDGNYGWVSLGSTQGSAAENYATRYYKFYDHYNNAGPGSSDVQYLIYYDGDSNYSNGGLYWLRTEHWYTSNPNRVSSFSCTCLNGEPLGLHFVIDETAGNEEFWVSGSRHWGHLYILRIAGQAGAITNSNVCAWYNNAHLANTVTQPSGTRVRGANFTYNLEGNAFLSYSAGETW